MTARVDDGCKDDDADEVMKKLSDVAYDNIAENS